MISKLTFAKLAILTFLISVSTIAVSRSNTSEKVYHINGGVTLTNNGILMGV